VKFGGKPSVVPIELIELIQHQLDSDSVLDLLKLNELEVGGEVRVAEGPFEGMMGKIAARKSDQRVIVLLNVLGAERSVELAQSQLDKA
jgi:transcriptional antiterminator RfaH